jgi:Bacterial Ig-like domain (group 2).
MRSVIGLSNPGRVMRAFVLWAGLPICLAACHASYPSAPSNPVTVAVQVHYPVAVGPVPVISSFALMAYSVNSEGAFEDVTKKAAWSTSDPSVIVRSVSQSSITEVFAAMAPGSANITAQYQGFSTTITIVAFRPDRLIYPSLTISSRGDPRLAGASVPSVVRLYRGSADFDDVTRLAAWSSSDPGVATVSADGTVRGVAPGTTQIVASYTGLTTSYALSIPPTR